MVYVFGKIYGKSWNQEIQYSAKSQSENRGGNLYETKDEVVNYEL